MKTSDRNKPPRVTQLSNQVAGLIISGKTVLKRFQCSDSNSTLEDASFLVLSNSILNLVAIKNNGEIPFVRVKSSVRSSGVLPILVSIQSLIVSPNVGSFFGHCDGRIKLNLFLMIESIY